MGMFIVIKFNYLILYIIFLTSYTTPNVLMFFPRFY